MTMRKPIVVVTAGGPYPWILINALAAIHPDVSVLLETPESRKHFFKRRARLLGWPQATGQFFTMLASRFGKKFARRREAEILAADGVSARPDPTIKVRQVPSANAPETHAAIAREEAAVVLLAGCRILSAETLSNISCPVINYHAGITPLYRGMMGGYWARVAGDEANYGTTVHLVDPGVDTGMVLYQKFISPDRRETMLTDAMAQAVASRQIVIAAVNDALAGHLSPKPAEGASRQHFHPPIWTYLKNGLTRGIW